MSEPSGRSQTNNSNSMDRKDALLETGLLLSADLSLPLVLQRIVDLARSITSARYGALGVIGPGGGLVEFVTSGLSQEERAAIGPLPVGHGILGLLIAQAEPIRIKDIQAHPKSVGFPEHHPPMVSFLGAPVIAAGRVFGNIYLTEKQGAEEFDDQDESDLLVLATQAGAAIGNAQLFEETRRREQWLDALHDVSGAILSGQDRRLVLEMVADHAGRLVDADLTILAIPSSDPSLLVLEVARGPQAKAVQGMLIPKERSISGEVIRTGEAVSVADASQESKAHKAMVEKGRMGPAMFVPLPVGTAVIGTLSVSNQPGKRPFVYDDLKLLQSFAGQAALMIEYARIKDELQRLAILDERERIAAEIHDGIIQSLFAVGMKLQATSSRIDDKEVATRLDEAIGGIDVAIRDLRNYIFGLRPGLLADRQLDQAIRDLAEEVRRGTSLAFEVSVDESLASELSGRAPDILQLVREAITNVARHATATTCRVSLRREDGKGWLEVADDGEGFDASEPAAPGHHGLANMRKRVDDLGGSVEITSAKGAGTRVSIALPL